ncbi:PLP-dependent cysteine synthase family protein [Specibacter cremeus]|uniref:PLP-dependent cysteine synthase family protein n=1 Tax=Specibacter cremeus TaxID=1629051 RepID=UPI000F77E460|nr:PLP-dependent cysteine synthase family protein [Specibacter cremeus]
MSAATPAANPDAGAPTAQPRPAVVGLVDVDRTDPAKRAWLTEAIRRVKADGVRSADTHLLQFPLPAEWGIDLYLKDESTHPTGSLKHRLARSLFLYGLCNDLIHAESTIVEASSGSTAISEAYFARLIGLPFVAVIPRRTSPEKIAAIEAYGGHCHLVGDAVSIYDESSRLAAELGGHYMDQFTFAERATDWRGNNNIAESIFAQLRAERHPLPEWIVVGAGTGGTSATIGRYIRYQGHPTSLCVADPENSAFLAGWAGHDPGATGGGSRIEGIGRPRMEPSFQPDVVDRMMGVPDAASLAATRFLQRHTGLCAGGSTGTNLYAALRLVCEMRAAGRTGSIVTLLCDGGARYGQTYYDDVWVAAQGFDLAPYLDVLAAACAMGEWTG